MKFFSVALKNLLRRRVRSALTLLGIAVGIAMLFSFMSFNAGYQASLRQDLNRLGAHMLAIAKGCPYEATAMVMHGGVIEDYLTEEHIATIRAMPNVKTAVGMFMNQKIVHQGKPVIIQGLDEAGFALKPWWVIEGERFVDANSVILPAGKATETGLTLGSEYRISGVDQVFTVTGILQKTGSQDDQFIYMPLLTAQRLFNAEGKVTSVAIQLEDLRQVQAVVDLVQALPDVQAITMSQMLGTVQTLMESAQALITSIVVVAVLISALGVLNSILTSVFERTREIGMMKAVGAGAVDIFALVWIESILLTASGGVVGIAAAIGAGTLIEGALRGILPFAPAGNLITFNPDIAGMSLLVSVILGVVAGAYPALRASQLSPMEAIRSE
ncbi:MAG: Macrolide export ATP-binding/permease protein MacB [Firmicutes bacterium]|nr:Macrolide export ATP-binding/permease protein MacB [candidate division NPL-UPA2 bacterium]